MRDAYHEELDGLSDKLVEMTRLVRSAMARASTALLDADLRLAEEVIGGDEQVNKLEQEIEQTIFDLMARQHPEPAIPPELQATVLEMGQIAERMIAKAGSVIASQDVAMGLELDTDDDQMDRLHRKLFDALLSPRWKHGVEPAVDISLAGRYFERFADHAVHVAENVVYLVTGQHPDEIADLVN